MSRLQATDLYEEFMCAVYALVDTTIFSFRKKLLKLRKTYAPRFFALGIDIWACTATHNDCDEYWMLFVDRNVAPADVKKVIKWKHLMWGMGTGYAQEDMAPTIQQYLMQLSTTTKGVDNAIIDDEL